jgi:hypothetical protein
MLFFGAQRSCSQLMIFLPFAIEKTYPPALTVPCLSPLTSCTHITSYLLTLTYACSSHSMFQNSCPFPVAGVVRKIGPGPRLLCLIRNVMIVYGEELLAPRPTPKMEDHILSAVRDRLFIVFAATLHNWRPFLHSQPEDAP